MQTHDQPDPLPEIGNAKTKRAPPPARDSAQIVPPWASTRPRAIARPRPAPPPSDRVRASSDFQNGRRRAALRRGRGRLRCPRPRSRCRVRSARRRPPRRRRSVCVGERSSVGSSARARPCRVRQRSSVSPDRLLPRAGRCGRVPVRRRRAGMSRRPREAAPAAAAALRPRVDARELEEIVDQQRESANLFADGREGTRRPVPVRPRLPRASPESPQRASAGRDLPRRRVAGARRRSPRRSSPSR